MCLALTIPFSAAATMAPIRLVLHICTSCSSLFVLCHIEFEPRSADVSNSCPLSSLPGIDMGYPLVTPTNRACLIAADMLLIVISWRTLPDLAMQNKAHLVNGKGLVHVMLRNGEAAHVHGSAYPPLCSISSIVYRDDILCVHSVSHPRPLLQD